MLVVGLVLFVAVGLVPVLVVGLAALLALALLVVGFLTGGFFLVGPVFFV